VAGWARQVRADAFEADFCSAIDVLTPDIDFGVSEQLDVLGDPQYLSQHLEADSLSTIEQKR
jgi:hypothetical protein